MGKAKGIFAIFNPQQTKPMLPVFRKIRRKLADDNKLIQYSRYAFGEIVLVVIGILIALQINNWNEERKVNRSIREHLHILRNNLVEDQTQLRELQQAMHDNVHYADSCMKQLQTIYPVDGRTGKYLAKLLLEYQFKPNRNAIETISQSNELPFLPTELQTAVLDYYALIESVRERENISNTQIQTKYEVHVNDRYSSIFQKDNQWGFIRDFYKGDPRELKPFDEEQFLSDKKLEALITSRYFQCSALDRLYTDLLAAADAILGLLEEDKKLSPAV